MLFRAITLAIRWLLAFIGMILVLFEELLWGLTGGLMRLLGRVAPIARVENHIRRLPPILALPLFVLPWAIMLPVKLGALWLIAMGKVIKGTVLLISGEALGVAFLARLYDLCRPALHRWPWFVIAERILLRWTRWAHDILRRLPFVRAARDWRDQRWHQTKQTRSDQRSRAKKPRDEGEQGADRR
jgi:hypothetical protein